MNILHVITDLQVGGVPLHLLRLAIFLKQQGCTVRVVSLAPPGPVTRRLEDSGIATESCRAAGRWDWRVIGRLAGFIRDFRPDVVHSFLFHGNIAARLAARRAGFDRRRLICEIQTVEIERRWHLVLDRWTQRLCRTIVCNSPSVQEHLAANARIERAKLRLIPGGVDVRLYQAAAPLPRSALAVPDDAPLLLWTGRLDPIKGLDTLVQALAHLNTPAPAHLLVAGEGAYRPALESLIRTHRLSERIHLLGTRDDVPRLLKTADVFVFPSRAEGLPNALLEAMAAGIPVVTTDAPGSRDLVRHEVTGLVVPVDDAPALAGTIERMLHDRDAADKLAAAAAQHVLAHHSQEQCFARYLSLYRETP